MKRTLMWLTIAFMPAVLGACQKECVCTRRIGSGTGISSSSTKYDISEEECEAKNIRGTVSCGMKTKYSLPTDVARVSSEARESLTQYHVESVANGFTVGGTLGEYALYPLLGDHDRERRPLFER